MVLIAIATADLPSGFYAAMNKMDNVDVLCVKNYPAGVIFTETYTDFEHLDKDTTVVTRNFHTGTEFEANESALDAIVNSRVIGRAHLAWKSLDPVTDARGRHILLGSNEEDLTGVFSINKFIQLWSNSTIKSGSINWIPCV
jgi:hypothetical protein